MVSPSTGFLLLDTRLGEFTITLPSISSCVGRVFTFKDQFNHFSVSSPTLSTSGIDRFDSLSSTRRLTLNGETHIIVGASDYKWYMISPDRSNQLTANSLLTLSSLQFFSRSDPQSYGVLWTDDIQRLYWNGFIVRDDDVSSLTVSFMSTAYICQQFSDEVSTTVARISTYVGPSMLSQQQITFE